MGCDANKSDQSQGKGMDENVRNYHHIITDHINHISIIEQRNKKGCKSSPALKCSDLVQEDFEESRVIITMRGQSCPGEKEL